jgi:TldD protein
VVLAPAPVTREGHWRSPIKTDPFDVAIEDKVALLLAANEAAMKVKGSRFVNSSMFFLREEKTYANSEGTFTVQTIYRASPNMTVTAVSRTSPISNRDSQPTSLQSVAVTST